MKISDLECGLSCLISSALFGSMLYMMLYYDKENIMMKFQSILNDKQNEIYQLIIKERMRLYIEGLIIGLLLGFIYLMYSKNSMFKSCLFTLIVLGVNNGYYLLYPKSDYMVKYLETEEQRTAWLNVYTSMKHRCYIGMVLGAASYLIIGLYVNN